MRCITRANNNEYTLSVLCKQNKSATYMKKRFLNTLIFVYSFFLQICNKIYVVFYYTDILCVIEHFLCNITNLIETCCSL